MAELKVPNLCGASLEFNAIQTKFESMMTSATDGLEVDASALKATLDTDVTSLVSDLRSLIPELPALPDTNLQSQLTSLSGLIPGSDQHKTLLADVTSKFGSGLTAGGFSLDSLVSDAKSAITGGTDLCSAVPNFTVPSAGGDAVEKAIESKQSTKDSEKEKPSVQLANKNFTEGATKAVNHFNNFFRTVKETGKLPTSDTGAYTVSTASTSITESDGPATSTGKVTTPKDNPGPKKKNVSEAGFSTRPIKKFETFWDEKGRRRAIMMAWTPTRVYYVFGYIDLRNKTVDDFPGLMFSEEEFEKGFASRRILPVNFLPATVDSFDFQQPQSDEYTVSGNVITITTNVHDYTGKAHSAPGRITAYMYYAVKYKYNSPYDPNQKSA